MELKYIQKGKKYLLAVSGGIDSMVMANWFLKNQFLFCVAHCNFSLRAEESDLDEQLVKQWCEQNNVTFYTKKFETTFYANEHSLSIQESARLLRYDYFNELLNRHHINFVATAHHLDDQIETVLFHFFRGTGIKGLTGIPVFNERIVRPMLHISKSEIVQFANANHIAFRNDSSNEKETYTRNKIRNTVLPFIENSFPQVRQTLAKNIARFDETNEIYQKAIEVFRKKLIEQRGNDFYIPIRKLKQVSPLQTVTYELIKPFHFSFDQAIELIRLFDSQTGTFLESRTHKIIKNRELFIITAKNTIQSEMILIDIDDKTISCADFELQLKQIRASSMPETKTAQTEWIHADQLKFPLILRKWRQGDYLYPLGMNKKKKVARVLIDAKISLPEKDKIWVLESDKKIVSIIGLKLDNRFKLTGNTQSVLQMQCIKKIN